MTYKYYLSQRNRRKRLILFIFPLSLIVFIASVYFIKSYTTPTLVGKWVSAETAEVVTFKKDGSIDIGEASNVATYKIIKPNLMEYTIENKVFIMTYSIEGRVLNWGIEGTELEVFNRR